MSETKKWSTTELCLILAIAVSPFWFLANNLTDLSEAKSTGLGLAISGIVMAVMKART